ncbi:hypothetical protein [Parabacteroides pacaensis]|uniref:hypothetical protein n=1 Tax=Parabacteroides pacaensis TaxID=2086575 RepID=UPI00131ADC2E|nr:hypothetical protein [Parabacteroides pacaensis]
MAIPSFSFSFVRNFKPMKKETMQIKFEGQNSQVDANTLVNILIHYNNLIEIVNKEYGQGEKRISLRVNAIEKGSFIIDLSPIENIVKTLFSGEGIAYVAGVVSITGGIYELYKWMKGKPIKSKEDKETAEKILKSGNTTININTINIYNLRQSRETISKSIETANQDESVEGISYSFGKEDDKVVYKRKEFSELIYTDFDSENDLPGEEFEDVETSLNIRSLSFEKGGVWGFVYNGFPIKSTVKDEVLMEHINSGAKFAKGDSIKVVLRIMKQWNPEYKTYINKSYKILEFKEHIQAPKQNELFK